MKKILLLSLLSNMTVIHSSTPLTHTLQETETIESVKEERDIFLVLAQKLIENDAKKTASELKRAIASFEGMKTGCKISTYLSLATAVSTSSLALLIHAKVSPLSSDKIRTLFVIEALLLSSYYLLSKATQSYNSKNLILKKEQKKIEALLKQLQASTTKPGESILAYHKAIFNK